MTHRRFLIVLSSLAAILLAWLVVGLGVSLARPAVTVVAAVVSTPQAVVAVPAPVEVNTPLRRVVSRYKIGFDGNRFVIPPITDKKITLGERLAIISLVAQNYQIPYPLLGAICFQEGWDKYTGQRCENWYQNGTIVTSSSGAMCALQIYSPAHPEVDKSRLKTDFTYCVEQGARILVEKRGPKSLTNPYDWAESTMAYFGLGKPATAAYWQAVKSFINNPPIVPETGAKAW